MKLAPGRIDQWVEFDAGDYQGSKLTSVPESMADLFDVGPTQKLSYWSCGPIIRTGHSLR